MTTGSKGATDSLPDGFFKTTGSAGGFVITVQRFMETVDF
jgi:hypothetical protein